MAIFSRKPPEVLPGVDPEQDCLPQPSGASAPLTPAGGVDDWLPRRTRLERALERAALALEAPLHRWIAAPHLNPLYYSGTLSVLLLGLVAATGAYLFFFYGYGFEESYRSVAVMEAFFTGSTVRAVHRYASGALLVTSLIHAFRLYFQGRSRGPRWLAWVSGVGMTVLILFAGITGYWMVMDQRAQLITDAVLNLLLNYTAWGEAAGNWLIDIQQQGLDWLVMGALFVVHFALFLVIAGFLWLHVLRLNRPKLLPAIYWLIATTALMIVAGLTMPVGMLPPLDWGRVPGPVNLDPLYLFWLPPGLGPQPGWVWAVVLAAAAVGVAIPWLPARRPPPRIVVSAERCTGCTKCALDCPYKAIQMAPRTDGRRHKYVAVADQNLCVSCGLCLGSCDVLALSLGSQPPEALQQSVARRLAQARAAYPDQPVKVVFTCERHAAQGARTYLNDERVVAGRRVMVVPLPCVGALHPNVVTGALDAGAAEAQVVGCPPEDCAQREGNTWAHGRLTRQRLPRLKRAYLDAPISSAWVPPQAFAPALSAPARPAAGDAPWTDAPAAELKPRGLTGFVPVGWRHYLAAFGLLGVVLGAQVLATRLPLQPFPKAEPVAQVAMDDLLDRVAVQDQDGQVLRVLTPATDDPLRLTLDVDGVAVWERSVRPCDLAIGKADPVYADVPLTAGPHRLQLRLTTSDGRWTLVLSDLIADVAPGDIVRVMPDDSVYTGKMQ